MNRGIDVALRVALGAGCAYEVAALLPRSPLPTISTMCWNAADNRRGRLLVWWLLGLFVWHIKGTGPLARPRPLP